MSGSKLFSVGLSVKLKLTSIDLRSHLSKILEVWADAGDPDKDIEGAPMTSLPELLAWELEKYKDTKTECLLNWPEVSARFWRIVSIQDARKAVSILVDNKTTYWDLSDVLCLSNYEDREDLPSLDVNDLKIVFDKTRVLLRPTIIRAAKYALDQMKKGAGQRQTKLTAAEQELENAKRVLAKHGLVAAVDTRKKRK